MIGTENPAEAIMVNAAEFFEGDIDEEISLHFFDLFYVPKLAWANLVVASAHQIKNWSRWFRSDGQQFPQLWVDCFRRPSYG